MDGGLTYCALKGYDHIPLAQARPPSARAQEIKTNRDPADTLTAIAVLYAFACQSPTGDLDGLGIRWRSVNKRYGSLRLPVSARAVCARSYPDKCTVHGSRRRAARVDVA